MIFGPRNPIRRLFIGICTFEVPNTSFSFDNLIILLIIFSCGTMAMESCMVVEGGTLAHFLEQSNLYATYVFLFEMVAKVCRAAEQPSSGTHTASAHIQQQHHSPPLTTLTAHTTLTPLTPLPFPSLSSLSTQMLAYGILFTPNAYLKSGWHQLDFVIVTSSVAALFSDAFPVLRTMRVLRVLRPLRLIARFGNLRIIVDLFIRTLPSVVHVIMVCALIMIVFAILGVQLFAGRFAYCISPDPTIAAQMTHEGCTDAGGDWTNPEIGSFDNIGAALLILFETSTMEGWPDVMWACIDASETGHAPIKNYSMASGFYMLLWVLLGGMFLINVFVGVIVETFSEIKKQEDGYAKAAALYTTTTRSTGSCRRDRRCRTSSRTSRTSTRGTRRSSPPSSHASSRRRGRSSPRLPGNDPSPARGTGLPTHDSV